MNELEIAFLERLSSFLKENKVFLQEWHHRDKISNNCHFTYNIVGLTDNIDIIMEDVFEFLNDKGQELERKD